MSPVVVVKSSLAHPSAAAIWLQKMQRLMDVLDWAVAYAFTKALSHKQRLGCGPTAANAARLRTKQGLLDVLVERARDQTSWTRAAVCRSWATLALESRIPMGHWLIVTELAIGAAEPVVSIVLPALPAASGSFIWYCETAAGVPTCIMHR